ncbi:MAG: 30S ribosomal protein S16 [Cryomorphaceae bacterium]|nr:30S ribosomal protein S16 [Cryomorphaceae bacterium]
MATKLRLQRHGRKGRPIYTIVATDSRSKRDGKYIENLGQYNPNTNPATIDLDFERALDWILKGAVPSDTVLAILKHKGVMMKKHLLMGVLKGALTNEQAESRFEEWSADKSNRIDAKIETLNSSAKEVKDARMKAESAVNEARAAAIIAKNTPEPVAEEVVAEEAVAELTEEAPAAEAMEEAPVAVEVTEEAVAEITEEAPVAVEVTEEAVAEITEEAPATEATEEAPAADATAE